MNRLPGMSDYWINGLLLVPIPFGKGLDPHNRSNVICKEQSGSSAGGHATDLLYHSNLQWTKNVAFQAGATPQPTSTKGISINILPYCGLWFYCRSLSHDLWPSCPAQPVSVCKSPGSRAEAGPCECWMFSEGLTVSAADGHCWTAAGKSLGTSSCSSPVGKHVDFIE